MTRMFDPNTNPIADDLLRLNLAPEARFNRSEQRSLARILAGKLYGLELRDEGPFFPFRGAFHVRSQDQRFVMVDVLFDSDFREADWMHRYDRPLDELLIVVHVGAAGVAELQNGPWSESTVSAINVARERVSSKSGAGAEQIVGAIPVRDDAEVAWDYAGRAGGGGDLGGQRGGNNGGRDGGGGGDGGGGFDGSAGAGGTGEMLNHPVLFAVEREVFDAILALT